MHTFSVCMNIQSQAWISKNASLVLPSATIVDEARIQVHSTWHKLPIKDHKIANTKFKNVRLSVHQSRRTFGRTFDCNIMFLACVAVIVEKLITHCL